MVNSDAVVFSCLKNKLILLVARFFSWGLCRSLFTWAEEYIFEVMLWLFPDVFGLPRWPVISTDCLKVNTERLVDTSSILITNHFTQIYLNSITVISFPGLSLFLNLMQ